MGLRIMIDPVCRPVLGLEGRLFSIARPVHAGGRGPSATGTVADPDSAGPFGGPLPEIDLPEGSVMDKVRWMLILPGAPGGQRAD